MPESFFGIRCFRKDEEWWKMSLDLSAQSPQGNCDPGCSSESEILSRSSGTFESGDSSSTGIFRQLDHASRKCACTSGGSSWICHEKVHFFATAAQILHLIRHSVTSSSWNWMLKAIVLIATTISKSLWPTLWTASQEMTSDPAAKSGKLTGANVLCPRDITSKGIALFLTIGYEIFRRYSRYFSDAYFVRFRGKVQQVYGDIESTNLRRY